MLSTRPIAAHRPEHGIARQASRDATNGAAAAKFPAVLDALVGHTDTGRSGDAPNAGANGGSNGGGNPGRHNAADNGSPTTVSTAAPEHKASPTDRKADAAKDDDATGLAAGAGKQVARTGGTVVVVEDKPSAASPTGGQTATPGATLVAAATMPAVLAQLPSAGGQPATAAFESPPPVHSPMALNGLVGGTRPKTVTDSDPPASDGDSVSSADAGPTDAGAASPDLSQIANGSIGVITEPHFGDVHAGATTDASLALPVSGFAGVTVAASHADAGGGSDTSAGNQGHPRDATGATPAAVADSPVPTVNGFSLDRLAELPAAVGAAQPGIGPADGPASDTVSQVSATMVAALSNGDQDIVLHLRPPELGAVNVRVVISGQQVSAWFDAAQAQAQQALGQGIGQLHTDLAAAGYNLTGAWVGGEAWTPRGWSEQTANGAPSSSGMRERNVSTVATGLSGAAPAGGGVSIYV